MRALSSLLVLSVIGLSAAAEPVIPPSSAGDVDPVTRRRAQEALQALAQGDVDAQVATSAPAAELVERQVEVEGWLREIDILLKANELPAAGERFLLAAEALKGFTLAERQSLGQRYRIAAERLRGFARSFAEVQPPAEP